MGLVQVFLALVVCGAATASTHSLQPTHQVEWSLVRIGDQTMTLPPSILSNLDAQGVKYEVLTRPKKRSQAGPTVVTTWANSFFPNATELAYSVLMDPTSGAPSMSRNFDAMVTGCALLESALEVTNVGRGGVPDDTGETVLDALLVDGNTLNVGAVAAIKRIQNPMRIARLVLENTGHSMLAGDAATAFAVNFGGAIEEDLTSANSLRIHQNWLNNNCQPNFWRNVVPDPSTSCGPFQPIDRRSLERAHSSGDIVDFINHDTVSMVIVDEVGNVAAGSSTNGLTHKIHGRVGDSPIVGAGAFADSEGGGCGATGDGDIMIRFLPCYQAVENMKLGMPPTLAAQEAITRIARKYPDFNGAIVVADRLGNYGAAVHGYGSFSYSVADARTTNGEVRIFTVEPHFIVTH